MKRKNILNRFPVLIAVAIQIILSVIFYFFYTVQMEHVKKSLNLSAGMCIKNNLLSINCYLFLILYILLSILNVVVILFALRISNTRKLIKVQKKLQYKNKLLGMMVGSTKKLIRTDSTQKHIDDILVNFINTMKIDQIYVYEHAQEGDSTAAYLCNSACCQHLKLHENERCAASFSYDRAGREDWLESFLNGELVEELRSDMPGTESNGSSHSILYAPLFVNETLWGFIGLERSKDHLNWSTYERRVLRMFSMTWSAILSYQEQQKRLTDLNHDLENRINEALVYNRSQERIMLQQARYAQLGEMINMIAHQWRQPINSISASAIQMTLKLEFGEFEPEEFLELSRFIQSKTQEMSQIINDFMNFFKPETEKEIFLIDEVIHDVEKIILPQFSNHDITLEKKIPNDVAVYGHRKEMIHIFLNLLNNARDAITDSQALEKEITITTDHDETYLRIHICDTGGGIDEEIIHRIFDPYFSTKQQGQGTGIGLYMTKEMIEKDFGGKIDVSSRDRATCFTITLARAFKKENS